MQALHNLLPPPASTTAARPTAAAQAHRSHRRRPCGHTHLV